MWLAVLLSCRDPILAEIEAVRLPTLASAEAARAVPVVAVTRQEVLLDPTPWQALVPDARPARILSLAAPQEHAFALPALVAAIAPLREAASEADRPPVIAVAADPDVPYRAVVRVLYSLGMAQVAEVELRVTTPSGPGSVPLPFPRVCGDDVPRPDSRLLELLEGPSVGPCVLPSVHEVPDGLVVELDEVEDGRAGCVAVKALLRDRPPEPATDWRGAVAVPAAEACPSVPGRDPAGLRALLGRTAAFGAPCPSATLAALDATPWGEVVGLLAVIRERHGDAMLAVATEQPPDCAPSWVLPP